MCGNTQRIFARVAKLCEPTKYNETLYIARLGSERVKAIPLEIVKSPGLLLASRRRAYVNMCRIAYAFIRHERGEYASNAKNKAVG